MTGTLAMKILFWLSVGMVLYTYLGYPLLLLLLASLRQAFADFRFAFRGGQRRQRWTGECLPSVSLVFSAYNEEAVIEAKMRNCAGLDYPAERMEILVGCDGCTDRTAEMARAAGLPNSRILEYSERSGKLEILNRVMREAQGEIVVFSDANTLLDPGAVRSLLRQFSDPRVGCVCGELRLTSIEAGQKTESIYWRYEVFLKFLESRLNLLLGANGGIYAIRRELFSPLPKLAIIDDFLVAMHIHAAGYQVVYDPEAVAHEETSHGVRHEFRRRVRIGAGNFHALRYTWRMLSPTAGGVAFSYWSHKIFRWLVPFALPTAFLCALFLVRQPFYEFCSAAGVVLLLMALVGHRMELRNKLRSLFSIPYYFVSMNLALMLGFFRFLAGSQSAAWQRTGREKQPL